MLMPKMDYLRLSLLLVLFSSIDCMTLVRSGSEPFKSRKAPSQTILNYSVVQPVVSNRINTKDEAHPVQFTLCVNDITVHLELNKGLLPAHFTSTYFNEQGEAVTSQGHVNCYYQGWVEGHPEWKATMSTCHGLRGSFGNSGKEDQFYHIEPLDDSALQLDSPHVLYLESEYEKSVSYCGTPHSSNFSFEGLEVKNSHPVQGAKSRLKRQNVLGELIVEWAVFNDRAQFQAYGSLNATVMRVFEITNYIDMLYRNEYKIRIVIAYIETWNTGDRITVDTDPSVLLNNFEVFSLASTAHRDSTMLITGLNLDGSTVGLANVRGMCTSSRSVGLTQDTRRSLEGTGAVAAHELGHIFNMNHDDGRSCTCSDPGNCIMSAVSGFPPPSTWSSCSREDLNEGFDDFNLDSCLTNEPDVILSEPVCGNGLREEGETCDCGTADICPDPCCNATSCQLAEGAQCFTGACCDNCRYRPHGTTCRSATHECDIMEFCAGDSSDCPEDFSFQNGRICNGNTSYCFSGTCVTYDSQCQTYFGTNKGIDSCYDSNERGNNRGNCGHDLSRNVYIPCASEDVMCGVLYCQPGSFNNVDNINTFIVTVSGRDENGNSESCFGSVPSATSDIMNPGLVDDGTRCGDDTVCFLNRCVPLSSLNIPPCPVGSNGQTCSGNGVCTNENMCYCDVGFTGSVCDNTVTVGTTGNGGAIAGGIIGTLLILGLIAGVVIIVVVVIVFNKKGKYSTSSSRQTPPSVPRTTNHSSKPTSVGVMRPNKPPPSYTEATHTPSSRPNNPPSRPLPSHSRNPPPTRTPPSRPHYTPPAHPPPSRPPQPLTDPGARKQTTKPTPNSRPPPPKPIPTSRPLPPASRNAPLPPSKPVVTPKPVPPSKPANRKPVVPPRP